MIRQNRFSVAAVIVAFTVTVGVVLTVAAKAGPPKEPDPKPAPAVEQEAEKPVEFRGQIGPGISALVGSSTEIIVTEVLHTAPRRAIEGARDTVTLKVVRSLMGRLAAGDEIGVYYHLLWQDDALTVCEPPKFENGKRYLVFLKSHVEDREKEGKRFVYELTDRWLSAQPEHRELIQEVAAAIRTHHGDARGEWSSTDGSIAGLQGRFVLSREAPVNGTPRIGVYLDLRNTSGGDNAVEFRIADAQWALSVEDAAGRNRAPTNGLWNAIEAKPLPIWLDSQAAGRLKLSKHGAAVGKDRRGMLDLGVTEHWEFTAADRGEYFLSGTLEIPPTAERGRWHGKMTLPKVRIPLAGN